MTEAQKTNYLQQMQSVMTQLGQLAERTETLAAIYIDRGYDAAAADAVVQADLDPFGVIPYDLGVAFALLQSLTTLVTGTPANRATVNKWRQV
jgi:hypothetical protein